MNKFIQYRIRKAQRKLFRKRAKNLFKLTCQVNETKKLIVIYTLSQYHIEVRVEQPQKNSKMADMSFLIDNRSVVAEEQFDKCYKLLKNYI